MLYDIDFDTLKPVPGFENYFASQNGDVYKIKYKIHGDPVINKLRPAILKNGYVQFKLFDENGNQHGFYQHRIIAMLFIENPLEKKCVNHKDGDRSHNNIDNLEWCTYTENNRHMQLMRKIKNASSETEKEFYINQLEKGMYLQAA